jgi:hypothetical protein
MDLVGHRLAVVRSVIHRLLLRTDEELKTISKRYGVS